MKSTNQLTLYAEASLARILVQLEEDKESKVQNQGYSMSLFAFAGLSDQDISFWKIPPRFLGAVSELVSKKLPRSGMMQRGIVYQLDSSAPRIVALDGGAFATCPTPTVKGNYNRKGLSKTSGDGLATWVCREHLKNAPGVKTIERQLKQNIFPTPTVWDGTKTGKNPINQLKRDSPALAVMIMVTSPAGGKLNPLWVEWLMNFPTGWTLLKD